MKTYRRKEIMNILGVNSRQIDCVTRALRLNKKRDKLGRGKRIEYTSDDLENFKHYFIAYKSYLEALGTLRMRYGIDAHGNE